MKLLHLLSDDKFVDSHVVKFDFDGFENVFLYLKDKKTYQGSNDALLRHIKPLSEEYLRFVKETEGFDAVITNGLGYYQSLFINQLPSTIKIFWCFFGAEIYNNPRLWKKTDLYAPETLAAIKRNFGYFFLRKIYHLRFYFKHRKHLHIEIEKAISRCNYFVWYIEEEHQMLNAKLKIDLPEFKPLSIINRDADLDLIYNKRDTILLGNSGSEFNNHLDALKTLREAKCGYEIKIPFSYGVKDWYKREVSKNLTEGNELRITLIENFVPYKQYMINFEEAKAAIYPSYRQMGLGNIIMCILTGVKIYLSKWNPVFYWLTNAGLKVSTIEDDLTSDIRRNALSLDAETIINNKRAWNVLSAKQNQTEFRSMLEMCV